MIDGRPRYHLTGCVHLLGRRTEPLPVSEAVELGDGDDQGEDRDEVFERLHELLRGYRETLDVDILIPAALENQITIDCDVLEADGGTAARTARVMSGKSGFVVGP